MKEKEVHKTWVNSVYRRFSQRLQAVLPLRLGGAFMNK